MKWIFVSFRLKGGKKNPDCFFENTKIAPVKGLTVNNFNAKLRNDSQGPDKVKPKLAGESFFFGRKGTIYGHLRDLRF